MENNKKEQVKENKAKITFLNRTKKGEYAKIDKNAIKYARIKVYRINVDDKFYIFSIR